MSFKLVLFLLAALLLVSSSSVSSRTWDDEKQPGPSGSPLASDWLVLTWPPGYCRGYACVNKPSKFTIHGLWPINNSNGRPWEPEHQSSDKLNETSTKQLVKPLKQLMKDMDEHWPALNYRNNFRFWTHEWNEHGRFTGQPPYLYFFKTIQQAKGGIDRLRKGLVQQSPCNKTYEGFISAITDTSPVGYKTVQLACNKITEKGVTYYYLSELLFCSDTNGPNGCPTNPTTKSCGINGQKIRFWSKD